MIDKSKIKKAAGKYANDATAINMGWDWYDHAEEGFKAGAQWAQQEFINTLWHDVEEMPKRAQAFIFECGDNSMNYHIGMMFNPNDYKKNAETWHMNRWCYLSDILPKEGGEE